MSRKLQDVFFKQAKKEGYLARSAYKLLEIQKEYRVISKGNFHTSLRSCNYYGSGPQEPHMPQNVRS